MQYWLLFRLWWPQISPQMCNKLANKVTSSPLAWAPSICIGNWQSASEWHPQSAASQPPHTLSSAVLNKLIHWRLPRMEMRTSWNAHERVASSLGCLHERASYSIGPPQQAVCVAPPRAPSCLSVRYGTLLCGPSGKLARGKVARKGARSPSCRSQMGAPIEQGKGGRQKREKS